METKPKPWYTSIKLQAAVVGLVLIFVNAIINHQTIDPNTVTTAVAAVVMAYMGARAWEDSEQAKARATIVAANVTAAATQATTTVSTPGGSDVTVTAPTDAAPVIVRPQPVGNDTGTRQPVIGNMGLP